MSESNVCVDVVPREQFGKTRESLESLYASLPDGVPVVYVDGNSPRPVRRYLEGESSRRGFRLVRVERYLTSNEARNIGLRHAPASRYVAFVDNDVHFEHGWLEALLSYAEETGAAAVGPLYLIGTQREAVVHMAGGELRIEEREQRRTLYERHRFSERSLADVRPQLRREPTDVVEFHCMLIERAFLAETGPFDERLLSFLDHVDVCLDAKARGRLVFFEPRAVVTHLAPPPLCCSDVPFFALRWSDAWMRSSFSRFADKHRLAPDDPTYAAHVSFRNRHRRALYRSLSERLRRVRGMWRVVDAADLAFRILCDTLVEWTVVRALENGRQSLSEQRKPRAA